jgi:hypothetical protein
MDNRHKTIFLLLVLVQGMHSIEEYVGRLWEVFAPARALCSIVSDDLETGFLIINAGLFIFGIFCWSGPVRKNHFYAISLIWFWIILELINGAGHVVWALIERSYVPGILTAPFLFIIAFSLSRQLLRFEPAVLGK